MFPTAHSLSPSYSVTQQMSEKCSYRSNLMSCNLFSALISKAICALHVGCKNAKPNLRDQTYQLL